MNPRLLSKHPVQFLSKFVMWVNQHQCSLDDFLVFLWILPISRILNSMVEVSIHGIYAIWKWALNFVPVLKLGVWHSHYKGRCEPEFDSVMWMQDALLEGKCLPGERSECDWTANCPLPPFPSRRHILFFNEMTSERIIKTRWILRVSFQFPQVPFNLASDIILCITVKRPAAFEVGKPRYWQSHDGKI